MAEQFIESTLMDGYIGGPHVTEAQTGLANQGVYGPDDYVLSAGKKAEAQVLTNNSIRIFDAVYVIQGRRDVIAANDYTDVGIDNGAQGMNRNDIIVRRYTKDESSEIESTEYAVIKGTPVSGDAEDPQVTVGDLRSGALLHEMKLYRVKLEGLNIVAVEPLFKALMDMSTLNAYLAELQKSEEVTPVWGSGTSATEWSCICKNNRVLVNAIIDKTQTIPANTQWKICTIPSGYRPAEEVMLPIVINSKSAIGTIRWASVRIDPDGSVYIISTAAIDTTWYIRLSAAWDIP